MTSGATGEEPGADYLCGRLILQIVGVRSQQSQQALVSAIRPLTARQTHSHHLDTLVSTESSSHTHTHSDSDRQQHCGIMGLKRLRASTHTHTDRHTHFLKSDVDFRCYRNLILSFNSINIFKRIHSICSLLSVNVDHSDFNLIEKNFNTSFLLHEIGGD